MITDQRNDLLDLLKDYDDRFPNEKPTIDLFVKFVLENAACFDRSLTPGHVTGSAWLTNDVGSHVLLLHHKKLDKWLQLGGHADGNPDVLHVAVREAQEESGIINIAPLFRGIFDIDIHKIPARGSEKEHFHYDVRFALMASTTDVTQNDESNALAWVDIHKIETFTTEPSMVRMQQKHAHIRKKYFHQR
jgi:8-oxo-dGTP pyrophosphatase MutT (NUDIX family)